VFETRLSTVVPGEHRITVTDPVTHEPSQVFFQVANVSVERRSAVRNTALAREMSLATGGQSYDLTNVSNLLKDFSAEAQDRVVHQSHRPCGTTGWHSPS